MGDGKPTVLTTTSKWERGEQERLEEERLRKEGLEALMTKATKNDAVAQTDSSVSDLSEVLELLSPRLHRKQVKLEMIVCENLYLMTPKGGTAQTHLPL